MKYSFTTRLGQNTCNIFNMFYAPCGSTRYTQTWKNTPSTWKWSIAWDTLLIRRVYMWIQPRSKSSDWPTPTTLTELWSFLGLANFYRMFVLRFSHITWALNEVTRGGGKEKFVWGWSQKQAFNDLKKRSCLAAILSLPDLQQPFEIETVSLDYVVGSVLTQHGHRMAYHSETLSDDIRKYPTYDKEMYSIVQVCCQWIHYIIGKEIVIHTDHNPLQFMQTQEKLQNDCH
jgi:hypothetical protein